VTSSPPPPTPPTLPATLPALTASRFIAALWVVVYHLGVARFGVADGPVRDLVEKGPLAVSYFFVLSGFVLAWSSTHADRGAWSPRAFLRRRFFRLWPVHACAFLVALPTAIAIMKRGGEDDVAGRVIADAVWSISMLQAFSPTHALAINPPAWSLSAEFFFSVLFAVAAPVVLRLGDGIYARRAIVGVVVCWVLASAPSVAYVVADPDGLAAAGVAVDHTARGYFLSAHNYHPLVRAPEFLAGVFLCLWVRESAAGLVARRVVVGFVGVVAAVVVVVVVVVAGALDVPAPLLHNGLLLPCFLAIVVALTVFHQLGRGRLWQGLGAASFALYMLHVPLLYWAAGLSQRRGENVLDSASAAVLVVVAIIGVSVAVYTCVERPLARLGRPPPPR
jgi:peptidoglycan/LPS O-acetylase OafA/YrhL